MYFYSSYSNFSPPSYVECILTKPNTFFYSWCYITNSFLLLALCTFILHHGLQQWRRSSSSSSSAASISHSDIFAYHMVAMELVRVVGFGLTFSAILTGRHDLVSDGFILSELAWYGEILFHVLTCVERYLAVVHPVTYRNLRTERGVRIRNASIGCVWLLSCFGTGLMATFHLIFLDIGFMVVAAVVVTVCSVAVLRVLVRPGPGGKRERVDQSKQRAFFTMASILAAVTLKLTVDLVWTVLSMGEHGFCVLAGLEVWSTLPSSLVLPLLFLHRHGKLQHCQATSPGRRWVAKLHRSVLQAHK